jgi:hypothetical protein
MRTNSIGIPESGFDITLTAFPIFAWGDGPLPLPEYVFHPPNIRPRRIRIGLSLCLNQNLSAGLVFRGRSKVYSDWLQFAVLKEQLISGKRLFLE